jgi:hypothetical protein
MRFKHFLALKEELNATQKAIVSKWPRDQKAISATDHYFGKDNDDIITPLKGTQDKSEIHKKVEAHLGKQISIDEYKKNTTTDKHNRTTGVSKLIKDPKLLQDFNNDNTRQGKQFTGLSTHTTRSAHGVAGQTSSGQSWEDESCKNFETGSNKKYLEPEVKHGTVVTYLKDHTGKEIARATLHPHHNDEGHVAYALNSYYGIDHADFKDHIDQLAKDLSGPHKGGKIVYKIHPDVYDDMNHKTILHPGISETGLKTIQSKNPNNLSLHRAIFNHPNATDKMLHDGIKSDNGDIAFTALGSSRLKREHIDTALSHSSPFVREAAMDSEKVTKIQLHTALKDSDQSVREAAMTHPKIDKTHIGAVLADKTNGSVVKEIAVRHKYATEDHINQGLSDSDDWVKLAAIRNRNVTPDNITNALKIPRYTSDNAAFHALHREALIHPKANETHFKMGLNHQDARIRDIAKNRLSRLSNKS